jgi:hypothetical protein
MDSENVQAIIRQVLTALGGGLVASGTMTDGQLQSIVGGIAVAAGLGWSLWNKRQHKVEVQKALMTPVPKN